MAPRTGKQADRKAEKKATQKEDAEPATTASGGDLLGRVKTLFMDSCIAQTAPKLQALLQDVEPAKPIEKKEETEEKENEEKETEAKDEAKGDSAKEIFEGLCTSLTWSNVLGLSEPASHEDAMKAWLALKGMELDFGPRAKRRGSPGLERIMLNVHNLLPQYLHLMLALMMLRSLLFRSFFACLPWLVGYQVLSILVPLTNLPQLPQVPLEQVPTKFRVAGTVVLHALMLLFFVFEVVWNTYFFEKFFLICLFTYHAYAVRPAE